MTPTDSTFQTGVGPELAVRAVYVAGMAPAVAWFDARNIADTRADWCRWDFGQPDAVDRPDPRHTPRPDVFSPTVNAARDKMEGPVMAWVYDQPGSYTARLRIDRADGSVQCYVVQVTVDADTRTHFHFGPTGCDASPGTDPARPLLSAAKLQMVLKNTSVHVHLQPGWTGVLSQSIRLLNNQIIEASPGVGDKPVLTSPTSGPAFDSWPGITAHCLIRGLTFDAAYTPVTNPAGYDYRAAQASGAIDMRGLATAIVDCDFLTVNRAVVIEPAGTTVADGALVMGCRQLIPRGIASQVVSVWGAKRVILCFNQLTNSVIESPLRVALVGADGLTVLYNHLCQEIDPAHGRPLAKAASTIRTGRDVLFAFNWIHDGEASFDPMTVDTHVSTILAKWNVLTSPAAPAFFTLRPNISQVTVRHNILQRDHGPCIAFDPDATQSKTMNDIVIQHNTFTGVQCELLHTYANQPAAALVPNFVCDATNVKT